MEAYMWVDKLFKDRLDDQFAVFELIVQDNISAQHLWRLSSEYVNIVSGSLPSPGSGEKGRRFSAFAERLEGRAVLCRRKKVLCLCRKVGRKSGSLPEEEGSLPLPGGRSWIVQDDMNKECQFCDRLDDQFAVFELIVQDDFTVVI
ncbi:hypothetical protein M5K25_015886 [Dendrobium thyrsiflorum]|uniref:Uncharacterized protein n=1 Tax=Dendrobium thyrsiflorum TaxID=117978 RepID=A0ABD0URG9_DENTH